MQTFPGLGRQRQPCLTLSRRGLTLQRMSFFFVSSFVTSRSLTILSCECLNLKNLFLVIFQLIIGTWVLLAQNILIPGKPRQAMWIDMPKKMAARAHAAAPLCPVGTVFSCFSSSVLLVVCQTCAGRLCVYINIAWCRDAVLGPH